MSTLLHRGHRRLGLNLDSGRQGSSERLAHMLGPERAQAKIGQVNLLSEWRGMGVRCAFVFTGSMEASHANQSSSQDSGSLMEKESWRSIRCQRTASCACSGADRHPRWRLWGQYLCQGHTALMGGARGSIGCLAARPAQAGPACERTEQIVSTRAGGLASQPGSPGARRSRMCILARHSSLASGRARSTSATRSSGATGLFSQL